MLLMPNKQLANEFHKPIIWKLKQRKVYSLIKYNISLIYLAGMQLISKYSKGVRYLLCAIDLFSKYPWVVLLKDKKGTTIVNAFQSILDIWKRKPNRTWVNQGSELHNSSFKKWLKENHIEKKENFSVAERFIRTSKNKTYKHMRVVSKSIYFDNLNFIVDKYDNTYHQTIKVKPMDLKPNSYAEYNVDSNEKDPNFPKLGIK